MISIMMDFDTTSSNTISPFQIFDPEPCGTNAAADDVTLFRSCLFDSNFNNIHKFHDPLLDQCSFASLDLLNPALLLEGSSDSSGQVSIPTKDILSSPNCLPCSSY
jgi:hypothetical protein